jgi:hypothetical protein
VTVKKEIEVVHPKVPKSNGTKNLITNKIKQQKKKKMVVPS